MTPCATGLNCRRFACQESTKCRDFRGASTIDAARPHVVAVNLLRGYGRKLFLSARALLGCPRCGPSSVPESSRARVRGRLVACAGDARSPTRPRRSSSRATSSARSSIRASSGWAAPRRSSAGRRRRSSSTPRTCRSIASTTSKGSRRSAPRRGARATAARSPTRARAASPAASAARGRRWIPTGSSGQCTDLRLALAYPLGDRFSLGATGRYLRVDRTCRPRSVRREPRVRRHARTSRSSTPSRSTPAPPSQISEQLRFAVSGATSPRRAPRSRRSSLAGGLGWSNQTVTVEADALVDFTTFGSARGARDARRRGPRRRPLPAPRRLPLRRRHRRRTP